MKASEECIKTKKICGTCQCNVHAVIIVHVNAMGKVIIGGGSKGSRGAGNADEESFGGKMRKMNEIIKIDPLSSNINKRERGRGKNRCRICVIII